MALDEDLELPRDLGPYTLLKRLAVGGMAEVYVAKTKGIGGFEKQVAVKVIHPRYSEDEHFVQMLVEEAKISVLLTHVNIAQTFDLGRENDKYYIVMEFIEGADAYRVMRKCAEQKRAMPIDVAAFTVAEICSGLDYAHRKRAPDGTALDIVHRDISPQNVLISFSGEVKLVDFGIAKAASRSEQTEAGVIKGKYYYMSPEQAWGDPMDHRSDIFSTGVVLYELLTGRMLYTDDNVVVLLDKVRKAEIPRPEKRRPSIPKELSDIVMKALSRHADDRYQSAQELGQALSTFLYNASPTFSSARLGELMGQLYPEQAHRHSSQTAIKLPDAKPSVPPVSAPDKGADMTGWDEDEDDETRHDVLPFRRLSAAADEAAKRAKAAAARPGGRDPALPTAPLEAPQAQRKGGIEEGPTATDQAKRAAQWEDPTFLRSGAAGQTPLGTDDDFDDSTMIESNRDIQAALQQHARRPDAMPEARVVESGRGRVHVSSPQRSPAQPVPAKPPNKPATKPASVPPPPKAGAWAQKIPGAAPIPQNLPASRPLPAATAHTEPVDLPPAPVAPPMPARPLAAPGLPRLGGPPAQSQATSPVSAGFPYTAPPTAVMSTPRHATSDGEADSTGPVGAQAAPRLGAPPVAAGHANAQQMPHSPPGWPPAAQAPPTWQAQQGPFATPPPQNNTTDTLPGAWQPPPARVDPFAPPPHSTQGARAQDDLGRPRPLRIVVGLLVIVGLAVLSALAVARLSPAAEPPALVIVTDPPGATVLLDGIALPGTTPLMVSNGLVEGQTYALEVTLGGHASWNATIVARPGTTTQEVSLVTAPARLRVETVPPGASVSIDGALVGPSPLTAASLFMGQNVLVRATLAGYLPTQQMVVLTLPEQSVTLTLTPAR